ncbi:MAG: NAD(P)-dependent oxidoreductase [Alphaproteobacteria bacterium]|nr:NAD(P)-dependent oxidoreductase [Alphaproteobacteria bacterium]
MRRIGFIGVGSMGSRMARRLIAAGHELTIHDAAQGARDAFMGQATVVQHPAACGTQDAVILMVANDAQLTDAVLGPNGLLTGIDSLAAPMVTVMSTVLPKTILAIAGPLSEKGARLVDAPVSGGLAGAEAGTLSIMVGGSLTDLDALRPIFETMSKQIFHCGALSHGALTKIMNNMIGVTNLLLVAEVMTLARGHGMDLERLIEIMDASSGRNAYTRDWNARRAVYGAIADDPTRMQGHVDICRKDLACSLALASQIDVQLPLFEHLTGSIANLPQEQLRRIWQQAFG